MKQFIYKNYTIEYESFGSGKEILLAFHGFGRHSSDFKAFEDSFGKYYKIYSINLFFHGQSKIDTSDRNFSFLKTDLKEILTYFSETNNIKSFSLLGYSLGGKIALCCLEILPEMIKEIYLFAPDGLKLNPWYFAASRTEAGRNIYKRIIKNPFLFIKFVEMLKTGRLIKSKLHKFILFHMESEEKRKLVFDVWMIFRKLVPNIKLIRKNIKHYNIPVELFFGKYDIIIPPSLGKSFIKGLENKNCLHIIETGHKLINQGLNPILLQILKNKKDAM